MKTKLLKTIRKYYEYKFTREGKVAVRNKLSGVIRLYESIEDYVRDVSYTDTFIHSITSHSWNKKKLAIREKNNEVDNIYWNNL
jgi:hypothetical protein